MLSQQDIISAYLNAVMEGIKTDAAAKNQKIPVKSFRVEVNEDKGTLFAADYFQYVVNGRGPGKMPPLESIADWIEQNNIEIRPRENSDGTFSITNSYQSLAYAIAMKIAREGTDVFTGKKPKIDIDKAVQEPMENFLKQIAYYKALNVVNKLKAA
jgi:hypothetical protein